MLNKLLSRYLPFFCSRSNFILRVASLRKSHQHPNKNYFPPPGYGIPKEKQQQFVKIKGIDNVAKYGFYLTLGRLARDYFLFSFIIALCIFSPLISLDLPQDNKDKISGIYLYIVAIVIYLLLLGALYRLIYYYKIPPVLTNIWPLWPEPSYRLLQSVPHKVHLTLRDRRIKRSNLYWNPKKTAPLFRQPQEYAKRTQTLQNVLLDFAVFELFFFNKRQKTNSSNNKNHTNNNDDKKSKEIYHTNEINWFYWLSPIFVNYIMLLFMLIPAWILTNLTKIDPKNPCFTFFIEPKQACSFAIIIWAGMAYWFMKVRLLGKLERLKQKIEQGYFIRHLNLVPPQILSHMEGIPDVEQIDNYLTYLYRLLSFTMLFAVVSYIGIIDGSF